ncbi:hypothetical protein CEXT_368321 [Caerostris extrusa]|uniref:Secreted protein n=1 Tax=Caerostris extrusa TaxID=172846 RepID=A0AAV4WIJ2_CAEEX|nr:hypothetical protein CEXT_368321 [Caerostris extrusa]
MYAGRCAVAKIIRLLLVLLLPSNFSNLVRACNPYCLALLRVFLLQIDQSVGQYWHCSLLACGAGSWPTFALTYTFLPSASAILREMKAALLGASPTFQPLACVSDLLSHSALEN